MKLWYKIAEIDKNTIENRGGYEMAQYSPTSSYLKSWYKLFSLVLQQFIFIEV